MADPATIALAVKAAVAAATDKRTWKSVAVLIAAILNLSIGCNYYKVRSIDELTASLSKEKIQSYQKLNKYKQVRLTLCFPL